MAEADFTLILESLRKLQMSNGSILVQLGALEDASASMSGRLANVEMQMAGLNKHMDHFDHRRDRIETRLGLVEA